MAEIDPAGSSSHHVVIDMEAEAQATAPTSPSCAVCMEAMEWVAVSPCGHREVCVLCVALIRFFHNDRRCCICRSHCATVVVTKASTATILLDREGSLPFLWRPPPSPAAFGGLEAGLVSGIYYWYHHGMGAYFDDVSQYQEMSKVCATTPASTGSQDSGGAGAGAAAGGVNYQPPAAIVNVVSAPARQVQADADAPLDEVDRPLSREVKAALVLLGVFAGAFILGAPLLYMIPT